MGRGSCMELGREALMWGVMVGHRLGRRHEAESKQGWKERNAQQVVSMVMVVGSRQ